jgi:hypothetical protein
MKGIRVIQPLTSLLDCIAQILSAKIAKVEMVQNGDWSWMSILG